MPGFICFFKKKNTDSLDQNGCRTGKHTPRINLMSRLCPQMSEENHGTSLASLVIEGQADNNIVLRC